MLPCEIKKVRHGRRLQLNAKYKQEKILQHKKFKKQLDKCLWLSAKIEYESVKAFDDLCVKLDEANFKRLIEEGVIDFEM